MTKEQELKIASKEITTDNDIYVTIVGIGCENLKTGSMRQMMRLYTATKSVWGSIG